MRPPDRCPATAFPVVSTPAGTVRSAVRAGSYSRTRVAVRAAFSPVHRGTHRLTDRTTPQVRTPANPSEPLDEQLESVFGATPHEFESRIPRTRPPGQTRAPTGYRLGPSSFAGPVCGGYAADAPEAPGFCSRVPCQSPTVPASAQLAKIAPCLNQTCRLSNHCDRPIQQDRNGAENGSDSEHCGIRGHGKAPHRCSPCRPPPSSCSELSSPCAARTPIPAPGTFREVPRQERSPRQI